MQRFDGHERRCEGTWEGVTIVNVLRIHLRGVTLLEEVCESSWRCWVEKEL